MRPSIPRGRRVDINRRVDSLAMPLEEATAEAIAEAAAVAIALDEANKTQSIKKDDIVLLVAFGAGLTWASSLLKW